MIVDCYTHVWESFDQLGRAHDPRHGYPRLARSDDSLPAGVRRHLASCEPIDAALVVGFKSRFLGAEIPNDWIAAYVRNHTDKLIGFAGLDPSQPREALEDLKRVRDEWDMQGVAIAPAAQDFHPANSQAMPVYVQAADMGLPVIFGVGVQMAPATRMEFARPFLLDEIARELPNLRMVVAHVGYPWVDEALTLVAKHANVYAEVSWLIHQPFEAYRTLLSASRLGVMDKLLFGSGMPYCSATAAVDTFYGLGNVGHAINLPPIPREQLRGVVERNLFTVLGLRPPSPAAGRTAPTGGAATG